MPNDLGSNNLKLMSIAGNLSEKNFLSIFEELASQKLSGMLKISFSKKERRFYFREGVIVYSENSSERTEEKILEMIKNSGLISRDTMVKSERKKSKIMKSLLEILIEEGHVSMLLYSKIISTAVRINIIEASFLTKGTFSFEHRNSVREVHGVRPVDFKTVQDLETVNENQKKTIKKILDSLYLNVTDNKGADYLSINKPFFQNYLITEIDFIKYAVKAADDFLADGWAVQSKFKTAKVVNTVSLYLFRSLVFSGICAFLYLATMTTAFKGRAEHRSVRDFYFFKVSLLSSLYAFETGEKPEIDRMILSSLISKKDVELSRIIENKPVETKKNPENKGGE